MSPLLRHPRALLVILSASIGAALPPPAAAQTDWTVKRHAFDASIIRTYKQLLAKDPDDAAALRKLLHLYKRHRSIGRLIAEYEQELSRDPNDFVAAMVLGHIHRAEGAADQALGYYERGARLRPKSSVVHLALGELYRQRGKHDEARASYQAALTEAREPRHKRSILRALAELDMAAGDLEAARRHYDRLFALDPADVQTRIELGDALLQRGKHQEAVAAYRGAEPALRGDPARLVEVIARIGEALDAAGQRDEALAEYRRAIAKVGRSYYLRRELTTRMIDIYRRQQALPALIGDFETRWPKGRRDHFEWDTLAQLYEETGDQEAALAAYRAATQKAPHELDTQRRLIALLENSGRETEVIRQYEAVIRIAPSEARFQLELAERYWRRNLESKAIALLKKMERQFPGDGAVHAAIAALYTRWGQDERALQAYVHLTQIEPDEISHLVNLGEQYWQRGKSKQAVAVWNRIIQRKSAANYGRLGQVFAEHDMLEQALSMYGRAIKLKPKRAEYYRGRATVFERRRDWKEAVADWEQVLVLTPADQANRPIRHEARRRVVGVLKRWGTSRLQERMVAWRSSFYDGKPPDAEAGYFLVDAYMRLHRYDQAREILQRLLALDEKDVEAMGLLVKVHRRQGDTERAVALLLRLAQLQPGREREFYTKIAEIKADAKKDNEAIYYAQKALEKTPNDPVAHLRLAERYEHMQMPAKAIGAYEKTIALDPRNVRAYFALARLYKNERQLDKAQQLYRAVLHRATDAEVLYKAGQAAINLEEMTQTLGELERALAPLAFTFAHRPVYRRILVELYDRYVPALVAGQGSADAEVRRASAAELKRIGAHGLKPLLEALNDERDVAQQRIAVAVLGHLGNKGAAAPLVRLAAQPSAIHRPRAPGLATLLPTLDVDVRVDALVAAGQLGDPHTIPALVELAQHGDAPMREAAIFSLGGTKDRAAAAPLVRALADPQPSVQALACLGLAQQTRPGNALDPVIAIVGDSDRDDHVRAACAYALGRLGDRRAVPELVATLDQGNDELQRLAAWALGQLGDGRATSPLLLAYFSRHERVRAAIAGALSQLATRRAARGRLADLNEYPVTVGATRKWDSAAAIRRLPGPDPLPEPPPRLLLSHEKELVAGLRDALERHSDLQLQTLELLASADDGLSLGPLTAGLGSRSRPSRHELESALARIGAALVPDLRRLAEHRDPRVSSLALEVIARVDSPQVASMLVRGLEDKSDAVTGAAIRAAAHYATRRGQGAEELARAVAAKLSAERWQTRAAAAEALGSFAGHADERALVHALADDIGYVREQAARALGLVGRVSASPSLVPLTKDPHQRVRLAAVESLARLQDWNTLAALARHSGFADVRQAAARLSRVRKN